MANEEEFDTDLNGEPPVKDKGKGGNYQNRIDHIDKLLTDFEDMLEKSKQEVNKEKNKDSIESSPEDETKAYEEIEREGDSDFGEDETGGKPTKKGKGIYLLILLLVLVGIGVYGYFKYSPWKIEKPTSELKVDAVVIPKKKPGEVQPTEEQDWSLYQVPIYFGGNIDYKLASEGVETVSYTSQGDREDIVDFYKKRMPLIGYALKKEDVIGPLNQVLLVYSKHGKDCAITLIENRGEVNIVISRTL